MNIKLRIVLSVMLITLLISACAPLVKTQPAEAAHQPELMLLPSQPAAPARMAVLEHGSLYDRASSVPKPTVWKRTMVLEQGSLYERTQPMVGPLSTTTFAGTWADTLNFSIDPNHREEIRMVIPEGCHIGAACGYFDNMTIHCKWEITLTELQNLTLEYKFSKTLRGDCPTAGGGTFTWQADGTLLREYKTYDITTSGLLVKEK